MNDIAYERRLLDAYLRTDFVAFTQMVFRQLNGEDLVPTWYIRAMAYWLTVVGIERQLDRLILNLPPRALKSTMLSVALPAFLLGHDPTRRIIVACYSQELSNFFGRQTRAIMQSDWYRRLFPSTRLSPRRTVEHDFATTRNGFRFATSTGGTLTGRGGDIIIVDDPLKADDAYSDVKRNNMIQWTRTTLFSRLDNKRTGAIIVAQQRLHEEDLSGHLLAAGGWAHVNMPAIAEEDQRIQIGKEFARYYRKAGEPLDPAREPIEILEQIRRDIGSAIFSAQYQQAPTPADGDVVKLSWFRRYDELPHGGETILSVDTASKTSEHNDYSAITIWRRVDSHFYLEHAWRGRVDFPELVRKTTAYADAVRADVVLIEDKVSGTGLIQTLKKDAAHLSVIAYEPKGDKETRLRLQAAKIEAGRVHLPRSADWLPAFEEEVRQFPGGAHDDQVDSMSQMLDWATERRPGTLWVGSYRTT